jgi:cytochrome c biogenesis protein CcdA
VVTWFLTSMGLDPELFRYLAAGMLLLLAAVFLVQALGNRVTLRLSMLTGRFGVGASGREVVSAPGQFGVGAVLGFVWLPCVGPTLGAAIALASMGQSLPMAFVVMLAYGVGTAGVLLAAGLVSGRVLARWRPGVMAGGRMGKKVLGGSLLVLALLVFTGADKVLEALAVGMLPTWVFTL